MYIKQQFHIQLDILPDCSAAGTIFESINIICPFTSLKPDDFIALEARVFDAISLKLKSVLSHL
jgi:hypothetical protein